MVKKIATNIYTAMETVADQENVALRCNTHSLPHRMDDMAEFIVREASQTLHTAMVGLTRDPYMRS